MIATPTSSSSVVNHEQHFFSHNSQHQQRQAAILSKLASVANPTYFSQCNLTTFRTQIVESLRQILQLAQNVATEKHVSPNEYKFRSVAIQYDAQTVENCLSPNASSCSSAFPTAKKNIASKTDLAPDRFVKLWSDEASGKKGFDWKELCRDHDATYQRRKQVTLSAFDSQTRKTEGIRSVPGAQLIRSSEKQTPTALEEIVSILVDPSLIPPAITGSIVLTFLRICTFVSSKFSSSLKNHLPGNGYVCKDNILWTDSSMLLCNTIVEIIERRPLIVLSVPFNKHMHEVMSLSSLTLFQNPSFLFSFKNETTNANDFKIERRMDRMPTNDNNGDLTSTRILHLCSLVTSLFRKSPQLRIECEKIFLNNVVLLLMKIDDLDVYLLQQREKGRRSGTGKRMSMCQSCNCFASCQKGGIKSSDEHNEERGTKRQRNRRVNTSGLLLLHDHGEENSDIDVENESGIVLHTTEVQERGRTDHVTSLSRCKNKKWQATTCGLGLISRTKIMNVPPRAHDIGVTDSLLCANCKSTCQASSALADDNSVQYTNIRKAVNYTLLPLYMVQLRSMLYQTVLTVVAQSHSNAQRKFPMVCHDKACFMRTLDPTLLCSPPPSSCLRLMILMFCRFSMSSSVRLCAALAAHTIGKYEGHLTMLGTLWRVYVKHANMESIKYVDDAENVLRGYCELVSECAVFDDCILCWEGVRPLFEYGLFLGNNDEETLTNNENEEELDRAEEMASIDNLAEPSNHRERDQLGNGVKQEDPVVDVQLDSELCFDKNDNMPRAKDNTECSRNRQKAVFRGLCYILTRRKHVFSNSLNSNSNSENDDNHEKKKKVRTLFALYVVKYATVFGQHHWWISPSMSSEEQQLIISTLQTVGILSFLNSVQDDDDTNEDEFGDGNRDLSKDSLHPFPFSPAFSLRSAVQRMGPRVECSKLLTTSGSPATNHSSLQNETVAFHGRNADQVSHGRQREDSVSGEPLLDYLDDDSICVVFSYLGYKKLARVTSVCKLWRRLGNECSFWKPFYLKRFKTQFEENLVDNDNLDSVIKQALVEQRFKKSWRRLFDEKYKAERSLRSQFNSTGWRYKTCQIVGCLTVLKSEEKMQIHMSMHKRLFDKRVAVLRRKVENNTRAKKKQIEKK